MARYRIATVRFLDRWQFWMFIAYVGLVGVIVALFFLSRAQSQEQAATARQQASHDAQARASNVAQVQSCFTQYRELPVATGFVDTQRVLIANSVASNRQALAVEPADDPLHGVRVRALVRLRKADAEVVALETLIRSNTPTKEQCEKEARQMRVPVPKPPPQRKTAKNPSP